MLDTKLDENGKKDWDETRLDKKRQFSSRPSLHLCDHHFLQTRLLGIKSLTDLQRKDGLQAVYDKSCRQPLNIIN